MNALRILILCLTGAFVCAAIRGLHPQIASAVALAVGIAALTLSLSDIKLIAQSVDKLEALLPESDQSALLLKLCAMALLSEFASDICRDSGEAALARRIDVGTRFAMLAAALPMAAKLMESIEAILS